jgi:hypothetical protein
LYYYELIITPTIIGKGTVHFRSIRDLHDREWKITEFTLTTEDGIIVPLSLDESLLNSLK